MSIHGISNSRLIPTPPPPDLSSASNLSKVRNASTAAQIGSTNGIGQQTSRTTVAPSQTQPAGSGTATSGAAQSGRATQTLSATAPPGTDPALWSVLSSDERAHFAKVGAMGPLTYGRMLNDMKSGQIPSSRGGRLDVKV